MNRKRYIIVLVFIAWLMQNIHRAWNNAPVRQVRPAYFDPTYEVSWHWHIHFILKDISYVLILISVLLYITSHLRKDKDMIFTFGVFVVYQISDLAHYILWGRHSEAVLMVQSVFMLASAVMLLFRRTSKIIKWIGY